MIKIDIEFYDKSTEFMVEYIQITLPEQIVFEAAETNDIDEINTLMYDVSEEMKEYVIQNYLEYKEKFDLYDYNFMGEYAGQWAEEYLDYELAIKKGHDCKIQKMKM